MLNQARYYGLLLAESHLTRVRRGSRMTRTMPYAVGAPADPVAPRNARVAGLPLQPALIFAFALAVGAFARFFRLGVSELSGDEVASWMPSAAPTLAKVIALQPRFNPGKLPVHEVLLHGWMALFGEGEFALRSLSAVFGVIAIFLVFLVVRELFAEADTVISGHPHVDADRTAALSTVLFSLSLLSIRYAREARMYGVASTLILAQLLFFLRAQRNSGLRNHAALAIFTAGSFAANFTNALVLMVEGVWILGEAWRKRAIGTRRTNTHIWLPAAMLALGCAPLAPFAAEFLAGPHGAGGQAFSWIAPPHRWEALTTFEGGTGGWVFAALVVAAGWGTAKGWATARRAVLFALLWMWLPAVVLFAGSCLYRPMLVTRYVLTSFVPFFALAALGIDQVGRDALRWGFTALLTLLMVGRIHSYYRKPHDVQNREAAALALASSRPGEPITVIGGDFEGDVIRYYLPPSERRRVVDQDHLASLAQRPRFLVMFAPAPTTRRTYEASYPRVLGRFRGGVEVISR